MYDKKKEDEHVKKSPCLNILFFFIIIYIHLSIVNYGNWLTDNNEFVIV